MHINTTGTQTGRLKSKRSNFEEIPKDANYMVTTNRSQMEAALKAVAYDGLTIIDAIDKNGKRLIRYTFNSAKRLRHQTEEQFDKRLRGLARQVRKTPAECWR